MIEYHKIAVKSGVAYSVVHENGVMIGSIEQEADGYYYFYPIFRGGYWEGQCLKNIALKLEALNKAWDMRLKGELEK